MPEVVRFADPRIWPVQFFQFQPTVFLSFNWSMLAAICRVPFMEYLSEKVPLKIFFNATPLISYALGGEEALPVVAFKPVMAEKKFLTPLSVTGSSLIKSRWVPQGVYLRWKSLGGAVL